MPPYVPTHDGLSIVSQTSHAEPARVLSLGAAQNLLQAWRKSAWEEASRPGASGYVANCFNTWANSLSDAIDRAAEIRTTALADIDNPNARAA